MKLVDDLRNRVNNWLHPEDQEEAYRQAGARFEWDQQIKEAEGQPQKCFDCEKDMPAGEAMAWSRGPEKELRAHCEECVVKATFEAPEYREAEDVEIDEGAMYYCPRGCQTAEGHTVAMTGTECGACGSTMTTNSSMYDAVHDAIEEREIAKFERAEAAISGLTPSETTELLNEKEVDSVSESGRAELRQWLGRPEQKQEGPGQGFGL